MSIGTQQILNNYFSGLYKQAASRDTYPEYTAGDIARLQTPDIYSDMRGVAAAMGDSRFAPPPELARDMAGVANAIGVNNLPAPRKPFLGSLTDPSGRRKNWLDVARDPSLLPAATLADALELTSPEQISRLKSNLSASMADAKAMQQAAGRMRPDQLMQLEQGAAYGQVFGGPNMMDIVNMQGKPTIQNSMTDHMNEYLSESKQKFDNEMAELAKQNEAIEQGKATDRAIADSDAEREVQRKQRIEKNRAQMNKGRRWLKDQMDRAKLMQEEQENANMLDEAMANYNRQRQRQRNSYIGAGGGALLGAGGLGALAYALAPKRHKRLAAAIGALAGAGLGGYAGYRYGDKAYNAISSRMAANA